MTKPAQFASYAKIIKRSALVSVAALFAVLIYISAFGLNHAGVAHTQAQSSPSHACTYTDRSFCTTETKFTNFIQAKDYSDLLEQQAYQVLACTPASHPAACAGATNISIQVFEMLENGQPEPLSRNSYIGLLRSYVASHGPCQFSAVTANGDGLSMNFPCRVASKPLSLIFSRETNGSWRFESPSVAE